MCIAVHNHNRCEHFVQKPHMNVSISTKNIHTSILNIDIVYITCTHVTTMLNTC